MPREAAAVASPLDRRHLAPKPPGTAPLSSLLAELVRVRNDGVSPRNADGTGQSPVATPSRRSRIAEVGVPVRVVRPVTRDDEAEQRMEELRAAVVRELAAHQGVPDPTADDDISPYASQAFATPLSSPRMDRESFARGGDAITLMSVGERVKPSKTFGKRVFDGGIPPPLPPSSPRTHVRYGKRQHLEQEAKRRQRDIAAHYGRKPDAESIFAERYRLLRTGILNVDTHKPCVRLPAFERDQRRACVPGLSEPAGSATVREVRRKEIESDRKDAMISESRRALTAAATARPSAAPPTRTGVLRGPGPENQQHEGLARRFITTASGEVMQIAQRPLVDAARVGRPQPQTVLTAAEQL